MKVLVRYTATLMHHRSPGCASAERSAMPCRPQHPEDGVSTYQDDSFDPVTDDNGGYPVVRSARVGRYFGAGTASLKREASSALRRICKQRKTMTITPADYVEASDSSRAWRSLG